MRPPTCAICGAEDFNSMELISFVKGDRGKNWEKRMKEIGGTGHPPWQEWFCSTHAGIAKKFSHLERPDAMKRIKKIISGD